MVVLIRPAERHPEHEAALDCSAVMATKTMEKITIGQKADGLSADKRRVKRGKDYRLAIVSDLGSIVP